MVTATRAIEVQQGGKVAILDLTTGRLVRRINLAGAAGVALDANGQRVGLGHDAAQGQAQGRSRGIVRIEPATGGISGSVALGTDGGGGLGISPDATKAIVAPGAKTKGIGHRKAVLVDLARKRVIARPPTGGGPGQAIYSADGTRLYVTDSARKTLSILSAATANRLRTLTVAGTPTGVVEQGGLALLTGTDGDDTLNGSRGADHLIGLAGNDLLRGLRGDDILEGGPGNDTLSGSSGNDTLDGGDGDDIGYGSTGNDKLTMGLGNDTANGGLSNDVIDGGPGNDKLDGGDADDTIYGGEGDDIIKEAGLGNDRLLDGGPGNDVIDGGRGSDQLILGGPGDDQLYGQNGAEKIDGQDGNDTIVGGRAGDVLLGHAGDDTIRGDAGRDTMYGHDGDDIMDGGGEDDRVSGGDGADELTGGSGEDEIFGGDGDDTIRANDTSRDFVFCGARQGHRLRRGRRARPRPARLLRDRGQGPAGGLDRRAAALGGARHGPATTT